MTEVRIIEVTRVNTRLNVALGRKKNMMITFFTPTFDKCYKLDVEKCGAGLAKTCSIMMKKREQNPGKNEPTHRWNHCRSLQTLLRCSEDWRLAALL